MSIDLTDLTEDIQNPRYKLLMLDLSEPSNQFFQIESEVASLIVISGTILLEGPDNTRHSASSVTPSAINDLSQTPGYHLFKGSCFQLISETPKATLLLASSHEDFFKHCDHATDSFKLITLSSYTVTKPWGYEKWFTENLSPLPKYALKMISMKQGHRSSLQSHRYKSETNYVIQGQATVLSGLKAPASFETKVDTSKLISQIYRAGTGWSNSVNELHRVIAEQDYAAIEVSTTELDDVIRWQDDSARANGRINEEHGR